MSSIDDILSWGAVKEHRAVLALDPASDCADAGALRKAYLKQSLICHPDRCNHPRATEAFQFVAEAYDVLSSGRPTNDMEDVTKVSLGEAFKMFSESMSQYATENGIEVSGQGDSVFDHMSQAFLFVDGFIGGLKKHNSSHEEKPPGRLKRWAENMATLGSIARQWSAIAEATRKEREAKEKEDRENGTDMPPKHHQKFNKKPPTSPSE